jgi:hypothetical protein
MAVQVRRAEAARPRRFWSFGIVSPVGSAPRATIRRNAASGPISNCIMMELLVVLTEFASNFLRNYSMNALAKSFDTLPNGRRVFHQTLGGKHLQNETWWSLDCTDQGEKFVVLQRFEALPSGKGPDMVVERRLSIRQVTAWGGDVAKNLQLALKG